MGKVFINTIRDLAREVCMDESYSIPENYVAGRIAKVLFKHTKCGITFRAVGELGKDVAGVAVAGYAEGADAECEEYVLHFPFEMKDFWNLIDKADEDGVRLWHEWNEEVCDG